MPQPDGFFTLHRDLPREGPGLPDDIAWVAAQVPTVKAGRILDAGCGPGADIPALIGCFDAVHVTAVDWMDHFIATVAHDFQGDTRVSPVKGDMFCQPGPFDIIWCAGAIYFSGIASALRQWRGQLAPDGVIAFTSPSYFTDNPSPAARAMWAGEGHIPTRGQIAVDIAVAGYDLVATRPLADAGWVAYLDPLLHRADQLWPKADPDLRKVLTQARAEARDWAAAKTETGYDLCVVRIA